MPNSSFSPGNITVYLSYINNSSYRCIIGYSNIENIAFYDNISSKNYTYDVDNINLTPFSPYLKIDKNLNVYINNTDSRINIKIQLI